MQDLKFVLDQIERLGGTLEHLMFDGNSQRVRAEWLTVAGVMRRYDLLSVEGDATLKVFSLDGGWGAAEIESAAGELRDLLGRIQ